MAEWRNWQTHQTQNLAKFTLREGSTPSSATNEIEKFKFLIPGCPLSLQAKNRNLQLWKNFVRAEAAKSWSDSMIEAGALN